MKGPSVTRIAVSRGSPASEYRRLATAGSWFSKKPYPGRWSKRRPLDRQGRAPCRPWSWRTVKTTPANRGLDAAMKKARAADVTVYSIGIEHELMARVPTRSEMPTGRQTMRPPWGERTKPDRGLKALSADTGGAFFLLKDAAEWGPTFAAVARELHSHDVWPHIPRNLRWQGPQPRSESEESRRDRQGSSELYRGQRETSMTHTLLCLAAPRVSLARGCRPRPNLEGPRAGRTLPVEVGRRRHARVGQPHEA